MNINILTFKEEVKVKKKLLLILALTLVVVTVVAGLAGCKAANAKAVANYLVDSTDNSIFVTSDVALAGYSLTGEAIGNRSFVVEKNAEYSIAYINDDGTASITYICNSANVTVTANDNDSYYVFTDSNPDALIAETYYNGKGAQIITATLSGDVSTLSKNGYTYFFKEDATNIVTLDKKTYELSTLKDVDGNEVNPLAIGVNVYALVDGSKVGDNYVITSSSGDGVVIYDSGLKLIDNVVYPDLFDEVRVAKVLKNGNILVQGLVELPDDASDYDLYDSYSYTKVDVVTVLYNLKKGEWQNVKGFDDVYLINVVAVEDNSISYQDCDNIAAYYLIKNAKLDRSRAYNATLSNKAGLGSPWLEDETMILNNVKYADGYLTVTVEDVLGNLYTKVYDGNKLINTVASADRTAKLSNEYYLDKNGVVRSLYDADFSYDAKTAGYEYYRSGVFDYQGGEAADPAGLYYAIFDPATKTMKDLFQDTDSLVLSIANYGDYYVFEYTNGEEAYYTADGTVILQAGDYSQSGCLVYTVDSYGAIALAKAIFSYKNA